jgi:hypothetical protein
VSKVSEIVLNYKEVCALWAFVQENKPPKFNAKMMRIRIDLSRDSVIGQVAVVSIRNEDQPHGVFKDITDYDSW